MRPLKPRCPAVAPLTLLAGLMVLAGCSTSQAPNDANGPRPAETVAQSATDPVEPQLVFINVLPWGKVDFPRGEFASLGTCNAFVRALPSYSFYTTSERCQPLEDPVYCTVWQEGDAATPQIDCFKGVGGCEVELNRHDLLAESGDRTIAARCEPYSLDDAWQRYQESPAASLSSPQ